MGRYVTPLRGDSDCAPCSNSHVGAWRGLGQTPGRCLVGALRTGGSYQQVEPGVLALTPDAAPGMTFLLRDFPYPNHPDRRGETVSDIVGYRGPTGRVAVEGGLMSDGDMYIQGFGLMGPNEKFSQEDALAVHRNLQGKDSVPYGGGSFIAENIFGLWDIYTGGLPECLGLGITDGGGEAETEPEPPPPPWSGAQVATISYDGASRVVTVYGADGETYTVDPEGTPPDILEELRTTAPQGTRLVIDGDWNPAEGLVAVQDWYIEELGEGEKKYGVDPSGGLTEQSPDVPSTDWPGGLPETDPRHPASGGNGSEPQPTTTRAGVSPLAAFALVGALVLVGREREE